MCAFFPSLGLARNVAKGRLHPFAAPLGYDRYLRMLAREGSYRLARIAAKYSPEITLRDL